MDFNSVNNHWWTLKIKLLLTRREGSLCVQVTQEGGGREGYNLGSTFISVQRRGIWEFSGMLFIGEFQMLRAGTGSQKGSLKQGHRSEWLSGLPTAF